MKHEITSLNTKRLLAESLKKKMLEKPLAKVTVSEIINDCGLNRKTFYYHFTDIYDLLTWMLKEEAVEVVKQFDLLLNYREAVLFVIQYVKDNQHLLCCAYDTMGRSEMKRFFYDDFTGIIQTFLRQSEQQMGIKVEREFMQFMVHLCSESIAGLLIDLFTEKNDSDVNKMLEYMTLVLNSALPCVLQNAPQLKE